MACTLAGKDGGMGVFECHIHSDGIHASARLSVFRPLTTQYLQPGESTMADSCCRSRLQPAMARHRLRLARARLFIVLHCRSGVTENAGVQAEIEALGRTARILQFTCRPRNLQSHSRSRRQKPTSAYCGVVLGTGLTRDGAFPALSDDD